MEKSKRIKFGVAIALLTAAGLTWHFTRGVAGSDGPKVYFYDLSENRLFPAPRMAFAPIDGVGGEKGDGVEALVVRCPQCEKEKQRIAYLKTHTPEYKQKNDEAERNTHGIIADFTRDYDAENTLVRRIEDSTWYKAATKEGSRIVSSWKRRCPTHGEFERPCLPGD